MGSFGPTSSDQSMRWVSVVPVEESTTLYVADFPFLVVVISKTKCVPHARKACSCTRITMSLVPSYAMDGAGATCELCALSQRDSMYQVARMSTCSSRWSWQFSIFPKRPTTSTMKSCYTLSRSFPKVML